MKAIKKYLVEVGYRKFEFVDSDDAMGFAQTAARSATEDETVEIHLITEAEDVGLS